MSFKDEGYFDKRPNGLTGTPNTESDKSIDEILREHVVCTERVVDGKLTSHIDLCRSELLAEILKVIPEKRHPTPNPEYLVHVKDWGYNEAIDDITTKLKELFKDK